MVLSRCVVALVLVGCFVGLEVQASPLNGYQNKAKQTVQSMAQQLGAVMKQKMQEGGPVMAIQACSVDALRIAGELSRDTGWQVKRVGTRVRNTLIGMPDEWEQKVLADFEVRVAKGEDMKTMAYGEMRKEADGYRYYRFMKAIPVQPQCTTCHGDTVDMSDEIREAIESRYPHDKAVGYKAGELRGAFSIKMPL